LFFWGPFPFVRIFLFFAFGIWAGSTFSADLDFPLLPLISIPFLLLVASISFLNLSTFKSQITGVFSLLMIFILGASSFQIAQPEQSEEPETAAFEKIYAYGSLSGQRGENQRSKKYNFKIEAVKEKGKWIEKEIQGLLYIEKDQLTQTIFQGDRALGTFNIQPIASAKNPKEFDQKSYYKRKGISHRIFCQGGNFQILHDEKYFSLLRISEFLNSRIQRIFDSTIENENVRNTLFALTLGQKKELSEEIKKNYRNAGAAHLLAVSGLHMGIVYLLVSSFLSLFSALPGQKIFRSSIIILVLFSYAFLTGFSSSAFRAALMLGAYEIGTLFKRQNSSWNSLGLAGMIICLMDPNSLFDVGFQLSFSAMVGIFFFYQKLTRNLEIPSRILQNIWKILALTISVTITTTPLLLYYFGEIHLYGILTNLFSGMAATLVISLFILCIIFNFSFPPILPYATRILSLILDHFNTLLKNISELPGNSVQPINMDLFITSFLIIMILLIMDILERKRVSTLAILLFCIGIFITYDLYKNYESQNQKFIVFFSSGRNALMAGIKGQNSMVIGDQEFFEEKSNPEFLYGQFFSFQRITKIQEILLRNKNKDTVLPLMGKKIYMPSGSQDIQLHLIEYIYVRKNLGPEWVEKIKGYKGKLILAASFLDKENFISLLNQEKIDFHDLNSGYFLEYL
jgi:competence protein ComEC